MPEIEAYGFGRVTIDGRKEPPRPARPAEDRGGTAPDVLTISLSRASERSRSLAAEDSDFDPDPRGAFNELVGQLLSGPTRLRNRRRRYPSRQNKSCWRWSFRSARRYSTLPSFGWGFGIRPA